ncbi:unnamed protein product [Prorocentrum cordatum]|uniref:MBD domain-containing protein n=1 Tax=Prorocentrum cordatum TaxID=2364126 RepID=A0ABN9WJS1_9DINO|nr:unnamed protein product [Polarella glacialis]
MPETLGFDQYHDMHMPEEQSDIEQGVLRAKPAMSGKLAGAMKRPAAVSKKPAGKGQEFELPAGWWTSSKIRKTGDSAGKTDYYWHSPGGKVFDSIPAVRRHLEAS